MAKFTRAEVRRIIGENCTDEIENAIVALHLGVVDPLKDDLRKAQADAEKLPDVQKELDTLKAAKNDGENWRLKYDALVADVAKEKSSSTKKAALSKILKEIGVADKRMDAILKVTDLDAIKVDEKGEIEGADKLKESLKTEWSDFIPTAEATGVNTANPPANNGGKRYSSKSEIMQIKDAGERQKAIKENITLFTQKES